MEFPQTEQEQREALQNWWKQYGSSVVLGVVAGIAVIVGLNYWRGHRYRQAAEASTIYEEILQATEAGQLQEAGRLAERLLRDYGSSPYGTFARLMAARLAVEGGDLKASAAFLREVIDHERDPVYRHLARVRLARVLLAEGQAQAVLDLLNTQVLTDAGAFESAYAEARGDALRQLQRIDEARTAYQQAVQSGVPSVLLQWKLDDLGATPVANGGREADGRQG